MSMKCPHCREPISMIASICPFCRSSLRPEQHEVPQAIMDAIDGGRGYDRSNEPVSPFIPEPRRFDLTHYLVRLTGYTGAMWLISSTLAFIFLPSQWNSVILGWTFWTCFGIAIFGAERIEALLER
jgi:hypothetical protein